MTQYDEYEMPPKPSPAVSSAELVTREGPALTVDTLDDFVQWAAGVPVGAVSVIRDRIAAARGDQDVFDRLIAELWSLPVSDVGRHHILLSTLGELHDGRAAQELARFVWHQEIVERSPSDIEQGCGFEAHPADVLQARAAEMLSYLSTEEADEATLRIAAEHPRPGVRAAAIDAHLFNHDDSAEEIERLRSRVRGEDLPLIGVPRFTRDAGREEFERAVLEFYERHPEQRGPAVEPGAPANPPARRSDR